MADKVYKGRVSTEHLALEKRVQIDENVKAPVKPSP